MPGLRSVRALFLLFSAVLLGSTLARAGEDTISGTWRSKLIYFGDSVKFELRTEDDREIDLTIDPQDLDGLTRSDLKTTGEPLRFGWVRDAGTIRFEGVGRWFGRPSGTFTLEPDAEFEEELAGVGIPAPSSAQLLQLVLYDVSRRTVSALGEAGYDDLSTRDLIRLEQYGLSPQFIAGMQELGYRPSVDDLIRLRYYGVRINEVHRLAALDLTGIPADDVIRFRKHGLHPEYLRGMADAGFPPSEIDSVIRMRAHGLKPAEVASLMAVEGFDLEVEDLIRLHQRAIDADYLDGVSGSGKTELTVEEVMRLRNHGIRPVRYQGFVALGHGEVADAIRLTQHGIAPAWIEQLAELGYADLAVDELVRLNNHGIDPDFVARLVDAGYDRLSVDQLIQIRTRGIDAVLLPERSRVLRPGVPTA